MTCAAPERTSQGNSALASRLATLFRCEEDADCEIAFVVEEDSLQGEPLLVIPAHGLVLRYAVDFFKTQVMKRD